MKNILKKSKTVNSASSATPSFYISIENDLLCLIRIVRKALFTINFILHLVIGWALSFFNVFGFRPFFTVGISIPFLVFYRIRFNRILVIHIVMASVVVISCIVNEMGVKALLTGLRIPIVSFVMFVVVDNFYHLKNIAWIKYEKIVYFYLVVLQLCVIVIQILLYDKLSSIGAVGVAFADMRSGTFYIKADTAVCIYMLFVILFNLFEKSFLNTKKLFVIFIAVVNILLTESKVLQLTTLGIFGYFLLIRANMKNKFIFLSLLFLMFIVFSNTSYYGILKWQIQKGFNQMIFNSNEDYDAFLSGGYARDAAVLYFLNQPLKVFGDGPTKHTDPLNREMTLGLKGEFLAAYGETGIIGLLVSILGLFIITSYYVKRIETKILIFLVFFALGITTFIYNNALVMFIIYLHLGFYQKFIANDKISLNIKNPINA